MRKFDTKVQHLKYKVLREQDMQWRTDFWTVIQKFREL